MIAYMGKRAQFYVYHNWVHKSIHTRQATELELLVLVYTNAYEICNLCCIVLMPFFVIVSLLHENCFSALMLLYSCTIFWLSSKSIHCSFFIILNQLI